MFQGKMRFSIKYKLLLTFFITTTLVVGSMLLFMSWSFDRGFLEYVNTVELEGHNNLVLELAELYREEGSWESLRNNKRRWRELHISSFLKVRFIRERLEQAKREDGDEFAIKPDKEYPTTKQRMDFRTNEKHRVKRWMSDRARHHGRQVRTRAILLDKDKNYVVGRRQPLENAELHAIMLDEELVGYLAIPPRKKLSDIHDLRFSKNVGRSFSFIALLTIVISVLVALPLARQLVKPVKSLTEAVRRLAAGEYSTRIPVESNDELGQLSQDFNSLAKSLEQNEKARQQWIADISHELRTPLSVLRGEIEALQDGIRQPSSERLASLHSEVMNLNRLIEDLYELSMSDIGALSYQKQLIDLKQLLESTIKIFSEEFSEKGLSINFSCDDEKVQVFADPDRLQQLFSNLLTNSLRYTDEDGQLQVLLKQTKDCVLIEFNDSEPGVGDDELLQLFERLYRVETSRSRATGGAGLGLSICKNIVDAHDGSIKAESSSLGGVLIKIQLPRA